MTLEESIAIAEGLQKDLAQLESFKRQIRDNEEEIRKPIVINVRRRSMFRYFWPWILFAGTVLCLLLALSVFFLVSRMAKFGPLVTFASYAIAAALIIIGIVVSKKKAKEDNGAYEIAKEMAEQKKTDLSKQNKELDDKIDQLQSQLRSDPNYANLPYDKRKSSSMARAKLLLQSGKAKDFEDALNQI